MIFVRGEVDKSQENYEVTAEVFLRGETSQIVLEFRAVGDELLKNMDKLPKDKQGIFAEQVLKQITELGEDLVKKYQEVTKE